MKTARPTRRRRRKTRAHLNDLITIDDVLQAGDFARERVTILIVNGDVHMTKSRDSYQGNTGFSGPRAGTRASRVTFNTTQQQIFADIDLATLAEELRTLRQAMTQEALKSGN